MVSKAESVTVQMTLFSPALLHPQPLYTWQGYDLNMILANDSPSRMYNRPFQQDIYITTGVIIDMLSTPLNKRILQNTNKPLSTSVLFGYPGY